MSDKEQIVPDVTIRTSVEMLAALFRREADKWWRNPATGELIARNKGEFLMLITSELSECMEAARKDLQSDHLPGFTGEEEEIADVLIRCFDYAGGYKLRIGEAVVAKLHYNRQRADHKVEARLAPGGKKF